MPCLQVVLLTISLRMMASYHWQHTLFTPYGWWYGVLPVAAIILSAGAFWWVVKHFIMQIRQYPAILSRPRILPDFAIVSHLPLNYFRNQSVLLICPFFCYLFPGQKHWDDEGSNNLGPGRWFTKMHRLCLLWLDWSTSLYITFVLHNWISHYCNWHNLTMLATLNSPLRLIAKRSVFYLIGKSFCNSNRDHVYYRCLLIVHCNVRPIRCVFFQTSSDREISRVSLCSAKKNWRLKVAFHFLM